MNPPPYTGPFGAREDEMIKRRHPADEGTLIVRCQPKEARPLVAGGGDSGDRGHDDFEVSHVENSGGGAAERVAGDSRMHTSEDEWHVVAHRMRGKGSKGLRSGVGFDLSPSVDHQALVPVPKSIHSSVAGGASRLGCLRAEGLVDEAQDIDEDCGSDEVFEGAALPEEVPAGGIDQGEEGAREVRAFVRRPRLKPFGQVAAHARFLQHLFRRSRHVRPGCWRRGGWRHLRVWRPVTIFACKGGRELASGDEFLAQKRRAAEVLAWYRQYVELLRRLESGRTPSVVVTFCGQGGVTEGVRRAGGASHGQDWVDQPMYRRRFGEECFTQGDSRNPTEVRTLMRKTKAFLLQSSPPCKWFSSARMKGEAKEGPMIVEARACAREMGTLYAIENVVNAKSAMDAGSTLLRGSYFGEHVDRPRLFETNFELRVDRVLQEGGRRLGKRTCMGSRRRWRRLDPFG